MAIRRLARIPAAAFDASYAQHPVVVQGIMDEWPAMKWTLEELESRSIKTLVPIEVGVTDPTANATALVDMTNKNLYHLKVLGNYMSLEGEQVHVPFEELVSFLRKDEAEPGGIADVPHLYLAQHGLENLPELEADVSAPLELMQKVSLRIAPP